MVVPEDIVLASDIYDRVVQVIVDHVFAGLDVLGELDDRPADAIRLMQGYSNPICDWQGAG